MALDKNTLITTIKNALRANVNQSDADPAAKAAAESAADTLGTVFANAIETYVKSGTVTFTAGNVTGGTPANGMLTNGAAINGTIS